MTSIRRHKVLYDSADAGTGEWIQLDTRYEEGATRAIRAYVTAGDTITLQGIVKDVKGGDQTFLDNLAAKEISTIKIYTQSEQDILEGNWTYVRAVKAGTAGAALMEGLI